MKIAVVGSGIAGLTAAWHLHREGHAITIYEADNRVGGHAHTHDIEWDGSHYAIDSGFIVFNDWTYPNFIGMLEELDVPSQPSSMSFSVQDEKTGLEYNGTSLNTLFAQRLNLLRPSFYCMIADILRFNREATAWLQADDGTQPTLGGFLDLNNYGETFRNHYILPMGAAIWSASPRQMLDCPARFFIRFFAHHGMLSVDNRPQWRVISGGSARYVEKLSAGFASRIRISTPVQWVRRTAVGVMVQAAQHDAEPYDALFMACHSDQALKLLADPSPAETEVLSAMPYQRNIAVLHTDDRMMPRRRLAHAAWNYHLPRHDEQPVSVTYSMNILQGLDAPVQFLVTLNREQDIDPRKVLARMEYDHPLFTAHALAARARQAEINGERHTYYCGAYWRNGFHEDGVVSSLRALTHFQQRVRHNEELLVRRVG
ncbi:MAG: FAD-dependent oxidoreductase [Thiobacillaceae bacterium]